MIETGKVTEIKDGVKVRIEKKTECNRCGMCAFPKNASFIELNAVSDIKVNVGDTVKVETSESGKLLGILLVFGVPLLIVAACVLIGLLVFESELIALVSMLFFIIVWEVILHFIDKKIFRDKRFVSKIIAVEKSDTTTNEGE